MRKKKKQELQTDAPNCTFDIQKSNRKPRQLILSSKAQMTALKRQELKEIIRLINT